MLTEKTIRDLKPGEKTTRIWDQQVAGLGVRVTPAGAKSFILSYRIGRTKKLATLARCSELSLKDARERAGRELAAIRDGGTDPLERRKQAREAPTVQDAFSRFFDEYAPERIRAGRMTENTVRQYRLAASYVNAGLGNRQVEAVKRMHIEAATKHLKPVLRNRCLAFLSRIFTLCERWEWRPQLTNPVRGIERNREKARTRVLAPSEMSALAAALDDAEASAPFAVAAIRVASMTGLRISECLSLRWENVDFETARALLPETKTGDRIVPLAAPVLELMQGLPRVAGNPHLFPGAVRDTAVGYKKTRAVFMDACAAAGLENVTLHDLRRTVATNLAGAGLNAFGLRDVLGHKTLAMSNRYVQSAGDALAESMERAAGFAAGAMSGKGSDVVPITRRKAGSDQKAS